MLKNLRCDVFLAAHGSFYSMLQKLKLLEQDTKTNPFIDPTGYREYLERSEKAFRDQLKRESSQ